MQIVVPRVEDVMALETALIAVEPLTNYVVRLRYSDGESFEVDFKPYLRLGGVLAGMSEETFSQARITHEGWALEFPGGIDFDADTLRWDGELARHGLTRADVIP